MTQNHTSLSLGPSKLTERNAASPSSVILPTCCPPNIPPTDPDPLLDLCG